MSPVEVETIKTVIVVTSIWLAARFLLKRWNTPPAPVGGVLDSASVAKALRLERSIQQSEKKLHAIMTFSEPAVGDLLFPDGGHPIFDSEIRTALDALYFLPSAPAGADAVPEVEVEFTYSYGMDPPTFCRCGAQLSPFTPVCVDGCLGGEGG